MATWWQRLRDELNRKGISVVEFERLSNIDKSRLYKYTSGTVDQPRGDAFKLMSEALGVSEMWLRTGHGQRNSLFTVTGIIQAGESWLEVDTESFKAREFDLTLPDEQERVVLEVTEPSTYPSFRQGDVLIGIRKTWNELTPDEIRKYSMRESIVLTENGHRFIKFVEPSCEPGMATLKPLLSTGRPMVMVKIDWIAPIVVFYRPL